MKIIARLLLVILAAFVADVPGAFAHTGHFVGGFVSGFSHPYLGFDHLLAMVSVGLWAAARGGRFLWLLPLSFVAAMAAGAGFAALGITLPAAEIAILASAVALLAFALFDRKLPLGAVLAAAAGFALFHGYAHGAEIPDGAHLATYGVGFLLATATLHGIGVGIGWVLRQGGLVGPIWPAQSE